MKMSFATVSKTVLATDRECKRHPRLVCGRVARISDTIDTPTLRQISDLPIYKGPPVVGMAMEVLSDEVNPGEYFDRLGHDMIRLDFGIAGTKLAVQNVDTVKAVLSSPSFMVDVPDSAAALLLAQGRNITDAENLPFRQAVAKVMSPETVMRLHLPGLIDKFHRAIKKAVDSGEEVLWREEARRLTMQVAMGSILGDVMSEAEAAEMFPLVDNLLSGAFSMNFGFEKGIPFTQYRRGYNSREEILTRLTERIARVLQDREELDKQDTILTNLLKGLDEEGIDTRANGGKDIAPIIAGQVLFCIVAGTESTSYQLGRALQHLSIQPKWLKALNDEQARLEADFGSGPMDRKIISRSAVAMAISNECLRLSPTVQMIYRVALEDTVVEDVFVPKGTSVATALTPPTRLSGNGNPEFDPEQWLNEDWTKCEVNRGSMAWGAGPRRCVGQSLATMETTTCIAILGSLVGGLEMSDEEAFRVWGSFHPTGMPVRLLPRDPSAAKAELRREMAMELREL